MLLIHLDFDEAKPHAGCFILNIIYICQLRFVTVLVQVSVIP